MQHEDYDLPSPWIGFEIKGARGIGKTFVVENFILPALRASGYITERIGAERWRFKLDEPVGGAALAQPMSAAIEEIAKATEPLNFGKLTPDEHAVLVGAVARRLAPAILSATVPTDTGDWVPSIRGVDGQVLTAASEMDSEDKHNPEWLWHDNEAGGVTYGRWANADGQAPYKVKK